MRKVEEQGLTRKEGLELKRRWRKGRTRTLPSSSALFRYLASFHDAGQEKHRQEGKAFIPEANVHLKALGKINKELIGFENSGEETATLDMDATLATTWKDQALYSYKGEKSYQPLNTYWYERGVILHSEFRDGNVPAGHEQKRVLQEALQQLPSYITKVRLRSDTAGYQHDLLEYCDKEDNKCFGKIEFAIGCDVTQEFRKAVSEVPEEDWRPLFRKVKDDLVPTGRQWAEVCFVPNKLCHSKNGPEYRYLATREELKQTELPGMEKIDSEYCFPVMKIQNQRYKVFGIVTNMDWSGDMLIPWLYQRCGKSEEAHAAMKSDFAGGKFPSGDFGENAAWWLIMVLSYNLNVLMKRLALGCSWITKRMKAVRFGFINIAGRVIDHARRLVVRISGNHPSGKLLIEVRQRIARLAVSPG